MIEDVFVFDNVVHMFNASEEQVVGRNGRIGQEHWLRMNNAVRPPGDNMRYGGKPGGDAFAANWSIEKAGKMIFDDSDTDLAMAQTVTLFDFWKDGLSSVESQYQFHKAFPERTVFCGGVDPAFQGLKESLEMIEFQAKQWGATSFKFYNAHLDGRSWRCDDREIAYPMYQKSLDLGVNLLQFHKGVPIGPANMEDTTQRPAGRRAGFPGGQFRDHHLSMPYFEETVSIAARFPNVYLALSGNLHMLLVAPRALQEMIGRLLRDVGAHRLLWGSEAPVLGCPQPILKLFWDLEIPEDLQRNYGYPQITREDKAMILGKNMARLMNTDLEAKKRELALA